MTLAASRPVPGDDLHVGPRIAVIIPCHNEADSVAAVVEGFASALPGAAVYVYDNNSTDATVERARAAGAIVRRETRQGKGWVVQRMFADVDADVYVMADGDATYDAAAAPAMVERLLEDQLDMVVGRRVTVGAADAAYRSGHQLGNRLFNRVLNFLFGAQFSDVFSGYRVMSKRFVKSFPVYSTGFEIESEMTKHAVEIGAGVAEMDTDYGARVEGSESKLRTYRDGFRILRKSISLFKELRPLRFFTTLFVVLTLVALALGVPVLVQFAETGLVLRFPTAILAASIEIIAIVCLAAGIIVDSVERARREARRLRYLAIDPVEP